LANHPNNIIIFFVHAVELFSTVFIFVKLNLYCYNLLKSFKITEEKKALKTALDFGLF